jgi:hypothetical protein
MARRIVSCSWAILVVAATSQSTAEACCQTDKPEIQEEVAITVTVGALAHNPDRYLKKTVRVVGRLENEGKNYFTDLRIALRDKQGNSVYVRPWLPAELPPSPPGFAGRRPQLLSQLLGKEVELTAVVERGIVKNRGQVHLLNVKSARVVR